MPKKEQFFISFSGLRVRAKIATPHTTAPTTMEDPDWPPFAISRQARQVYDDVAIAAPQDCPELPPPRVHPASRNVQCNVQLFGSDSFVQESVYLMKDAPPTVAVENAYRIIVPSKTVPIERAGQRWGEVIKAVRLTCNEMTGAGTCRSFAEPDPHGPCCYVAIKKLRKRVFQPMIERGCQENPYSEISLMQAVADNEHVLGCIEALEDDKYLYIVMPYLDGGELFYAIHPSDTGQPSFVTQAGRAALPEAQARIYFRQILECVNFLHSRNVAHLDISPENIMLNNGRCILIDLGGARPVPMERNGDGKRALFHPSNVPFGKKQYLPFEVLKGDSFDGFAVDLWSVVITLFHMLVGDTLGPSATWVLRYETILEFLSHSTHLRFLLEGQNGYAINLLDKILRRNPSTRATLEQLTQDPWVSSLAIPFLPLEHYLVPLP